MPYKRYQDILQKLLKNNSLRTLPNVVQQQTNITFNGKEYINFSSNDYLGLASDKDLHNEFFEQLNSDNLLTDYQLSASSSRLLTGNVQAYSQLEQTLEDMYGNPALIFNSGYHANIGILPALSTKHDLILSDKLNHASIVDGCNLSRAKTIRYKHLDYNQIERILKTTRNNYEQVFLVSESIFSMDGDVADLKHLTKLKKEYNLILYIDEAHGVGSQGQQGLGVSEQTQTLQDIDILIGTFGKAYASQGAFAICPSTIKQYLINTARSLIFTTGLPPITLSWINFIANKMPYFYKQRQHLQKLSEYTINAFAEMGFNIPSQSNIIPLVVHQNNKAEQMAEILQKQGFLLLPIRPPTVPENQARLRLSLTADMSFEQINKLIEVL